MSREIKFRGKDEQGRWWFGDLRHTMMIYGKPHCRIVNVDKDDYDRLQEIWSDRIDEATIGQFTGVLDGRNQEIYENDIVATYFDGHCTYQGEVRFEAGRFIVSTNNGLLTNIGGKSWLVIGNIHENPELLKGGDQ